MKLSNFAVLFSVAPQKTKQQQQRQEEVEEGSNKGRQHRTITSSVEEEGRKEEGREGKGRGGHYEHTKEHAKESEHNETLTSTRHNENARREQHSPQRGLGEKGNQWK